MLRAQGTYQCGYRRLTCCQASPVPPFTGYDLVMTIFRHDDDRLQDAVRLDARCQISEAVFIESTARLIRIRFDLAEFDIPKITDLLVIARTWIERLIK